MFLDAGVAAQDDWLHQIHVMAHRIDRMPYAVQLDSAMPTLAMDQLNSDGAKAFRADLDQRRANFKLRWTQNR